MAMTVAITRLDLTEADLRGAAARTQDARASRRMLAIALLLEGWSRESAAEACAMDRQTLRDWVHRYNAFGLAGLYNQARRNGPPPRLSSEQGATVAEWVEQGPDLERDGVVRWRCVDLQQRIKQAFAVSLHERTVGKRLRKLSFRRLSVRPQHRQSAPQSKRFSERLCRSHDRRAATRGGRQAGGNMVYRRSSCRAAGDADPGVGETWLASPCPARPTLRMGVSVRGDLPGAPHRCCHHYAGGEYRGP